MSYERTIYLNCEDSATLDNMNAEIVLLMMEANTVAAKMIDKKKEVVGIVKGLEEKIAAEELLQKDLVKVLEREKKALQE